jgi:hypothetical protein
MSWSPERRLLSVAEKKGTKMAAKWSRAKGVVRSEPFPLLRSVVQNGPEPSKGAPLLGAAKRTFDGEDRSEMIAEEGKAGRKIGEKWSAILVPSAAASNSLLASAEELVVAELPLSDLRGNLSGARAGLGLSFNNRGACLTFGGQRRSHELFNLAGSRSGPFFGEVAWHFLILPLLRYCRVGLAFLNTSPFPAIYRDSAKTTAQHPRGSLC